MCFRSPCHPWGLPPQIGNRSEGQRVGRLLLLPSVDNNNNLLPTGNEIRSIRKDRRVNLISDVDSGLIINGYLFLFKGKWIFDLHV